MAINWQLYHWHLEPSSFCALNCPRCPRVEHPDTPWLNKSMTLDFVKSFLTEQRLINDVKRITMCGDVGDPIYCKEYLEICRYIKSTNPKIHIFTITNGSHRPTAWWQELGSILNERDVINFSVDGFDQFSNNIYRVGSNFDSVVNGIKAVREVNKNVFLNWAMILFAFNQDHKEKVIDMAKSLDMDALQLTKSTKFGSKYGAAYQGDDDPLEPRPENISSSHRYERSIINISNRTLDNSEYMQTNQRMFRLVRDQYQDSPIVPMCEIGNRGIYVNAEGVVFPCSWTSFPYTSLSHDGKTIHWQDSFFAKYRQRMSLHHRSLDEILGDPAWDKCSSGWRDPRKTWVECNQKCGRNLVTEEYAVGWETN